MSRQANIIELGDLGENTIKDLHIKHGYEVVMSEDRYDKVKDMFINGVKSEIKTLTRIKNETAFFLANNQLKKCLEVDRLIFVEIPLYEDFPIDIFESLKPRVTKPHQFTNKETGKVTHGLLFPLTNLVYLGSIEDRNLVKKMRDLSPSFFVHNKPEYKERYKAQRLEIISNIERCAI